MSIPLKAFMTSAGVVVLTVIHHVYGAVIYSTPWRHHIALIALPVLAALFVAYHVHTRHPRTTAGRAAMYVFTVITTLFSVGLIGFFEGGYNHLVKNVLYFGGASSSLLGRLFPAPTYEMPDDLLFEMTGILQFVVAFAAAYYTVRFWREGRRRTAAA